MKKNKEKLEYWECKNIAQDNPEYSFVIDPLDWADCEDNVDKIVWNDESKKISKEDILAKQKELQTAYDNNKYQRDRIEEYPSIGDQLDMIYHAGQGGDTFQKAIKAVKDKYPKG